MRRAPRATLRVGRHRPAGWERRCPELGPCVGARRRGSVDFSLNRVVWDAGRAAAALGARRGRRRCSEPRKRRNVVLILLPNVTNSSVVFARVRDLHFHKVQRRSEVNYFRRPSLPQARAAQLVPLFPLI